MRWRALLPFFLLSIFGLGALTACGSDSESSGSATVPVIVKVTISDGKIAVSPAGEVDVSVGQEVSLEITSTVGDEVHVHSNPEQEHEFTAGSTTLDLGSFSVPGQIDVEVHELDTKLVTLVVK